VKVWWITLITALQNKIASDTLAGQAFHRHQIDDLPVMYFFGHDGSSKSCGCNPPQCSSAFSAADASRDCAFYRCARWDSLRRCAFRRGGSRRCFHVTLATHPLSCSALLARAHITLMRANGTAGRGGTAIKAEKITVAFWAFPPNHCQLMRGRAQSRCSRLYAFDYLGSGASKSGPSAASSGTAALSRRQALPRGWGLDRTKTALGDRV